jgi:hypothetical protein
MSTFMVVIAVVAVVAVVAGAGFLAWNLARTQRLRRQFGPEYDRAVDQHGGRREAERDLHARERHHHDLAIRPLDPGSRTRYLDQWTHIQAEFVDSPEVSVDLADKLVIAVMGERGYPTDDYEARVTELSVEHAQTLGHYRSGHEISTSGEASTEDLRQAMVHYRTLIEDLLSAPWDERVPTPSATGIPAPRGSGPN